ncbi:MAG: DNA glycosylase AlkZ-like family protein, partial [Thermomicrobiales bacterium]
LLSPFDNLIWHRPRTAALFGFDYRLECYTPAPKRRYGYYSLPILHRGRLIGRLDPSHNRRTGLLTIKCLHLEPDIRFSKTIARAIAGALNDLATFLGATGIAIVESDPREVAAAIKHLL